MYSEPGQLNWLRHTCTGPAPLLEACPAENIVGMGMAQGNFEGSLFGARYDVIDLISDSSACNHPKQEMI